MRQLLAILLMVMGMQPVTVMPCGPESAEPAVHAAHGNGNRGSGNMDQQSGHDCCDTTHSGAAQECSRALDCHHAASVNWTLPESSLALLASPVKHFMAIADSAVPKAAAPPPLRPPQA